MANEDFDDFGFTAVDEDDLGVVNPLQERLERMRAAIDKLLDNLEKNPDKDIIKWPDRARKIAEFRQRLDKIQYGE